MKKLFSGLLTVGAMGFSLVVHADVKPAGTILSTQCGENKIAGEGPEAILEVCLASVQGEPGVQLVVLKRRNNGIVKVDDAYLPIVGRSAAKKDEPKEHKTETLTLGTDSVKALDRHTIYVSTRATLVAKLSLTATKPVYIPESIAGSDLQGNKFQVKKLQAIFHTQGVGIESLQSEQQDE